MDHRLRIDWIRCEGYGLCGDYAPELIVLDEWRYPLVPSEAVEPRLMDQASRAVDCCPVRALSLVPDGPSGSRAGRTDRLQPRRPGQG
jgi:ferredoxin